MTSKLRRSTMEADKTTLHNNTEAIRAEFKDYAYSVSHDLSAPVRAMVEFSRLLTTEHADTLNDEGKEFLSLIIENGEKLQEMMDGLLAYSRLNTMAKPFCEVSPSRIVEDCRTILEKQILISGTEIHVSEMPTIKADTEQLMQVFHALIDNGIKFQPKENKPIINISAEEKDGAWQFAVTDNGIGIDPKYQEKVYQLFQRLHTDDEYPGVGIGLTLAKKIVQRHGGNIWYEPNPDQGITSYFTVPVQLP